MPDTIPAIDDTVSEAASENRPKRGRPRVTPPEWDNFAALPTTFHGKSRRTVIKGFHSGMAHCVLGEDERFRYITGEPDPRTEILAELGRLSNPDKIRKAATYICEHRVKTKDAVALVRSWRTGKATTGDFRALGDAIANVIESYAAQHPGTTRKDVRLALWLVGMDYGEGELDEGDERSGGDRVAE